MAGDETCRCGHQKANHRADEGCCYVGNCWCGSFRLHSQDEIAALRAQAAALAAALRDLMGVIERLGPVTTPTMERAREVLQQYDTAHGKG